MAHSEGTEIPNFADDIRQIRILSFASHKKSLLYAGYKDKEYNNWNLASEFALANKMFPIQTTVGGQYLETPDRKTELKYSKYQYRRVWDRASVKYCVNIEGSVKTFVCGSNDASTFRRKEIHAMLKSHTIDDINGRDISEYARLRRAVMGRLNDEGTLPQPERHRRTINTVFRAIAFQEIRQDLAIAREQNNGEEIPSIFARVAHLRTQQHEDLQRRFQSPDTQKLAEKLAVEEEITGANPGLHLRLAHGR